MSLLRFTALHIIKIIAPLLIKRKGKILAHIVNSSFNPKINPIWCFFDPLPFDLNYPRQFLSLVNEKPQKLEFQKLFFLKSFSLIHSRRKSFEDWIKNVKGEMILVVSLFSFFGYIKRNDEKYYKQTETRASWCSKWKILNQNKM